MGGGVLSSGFFSGTPAFLSQQRVPFLQLLVLATILAGGLHKPIITLGMQTPGHFLDLGGSGSGGRVGRGGVGGGLFCVGGLGGALVMQQRPLPGQMARRSISSQRRAKNPVTQVPRQRFSGGMSAKSCDGFFGLWGRSFSFSPFTDSFCLITSVVELSDVCMSSFESSSMIALLSLHRGSFLGNTNSLGGSSFINIFLATQQRRFVLQR